MRYNRSYFEKLLTKRGWYLVEGNSQWKIYSHSPHGTIDRLTQFFIILPRYRVIVYYGLGSFWFPRRHIIAIKGYLKTHYKYNFQHYAGEYEELKDFLLGKKTLFRENLHRYKELE